MQQRSCAPSTRSKNGTSWTNRIGLSPKRIAKQKRASINPVDFFWEIPVIYGPRVSGSHVGRSCWKSSFVLLNMASLCWYQFVKFLGCKNPLRPRVLKKPCDILGTIKVATDGVFSILLNEVRRFLRSPESSKNPQSSSHGVRQIWIQ